MNHSTFGKKPTTAIPADRASVLATAARLVRTTVADVRAAAAARLALRTETTARLLNLSRSSDAETAQRRAFTDSAHLPPACPALVAACATPNGPNFLPDAHLTYAVGWRSPA